MATRRRRGWPRWRARRAPSRGSPRASPTSTCASLRRLERTRLLVRAGPALGLMGTLIPLSPALSGLAGGDVDAADRQPARRVLDHRARPARRRGRVRRSRSCATASTRRTCPTSSSSPHSLEERMIRVTPRAQRHRDRDGDPLDGLVNMFDLGIVLAVAFLLAALQSVDLTDLLTKKDVTIVRKTAAARRSSSSAATSCAPLRLSRPARARGRGRARRLGLPAARRPARLRRDEEARRSDAGRSSTISAADAADRLRVDARSPPLIGLPLGVWLGLGALPRARAVLLGPSTPGCGCRRWRSASCCGC